MSNGLSEVQGFRSLQVLHESARRVVVRAVRLADDRRVVLKRLRDEHPSLEEIGRVRHECAVLGKLAGPGVVAVQGVVPDGSSVALVLDDCDARPLSALLAAGPIEVGLALRYAAAVARILGQVHAAGWVHRDVNPQNVLVDGQGRVTLIDFELAGEVAILANDTRGPLVGTLAVLAPEQSGRMGRGVDERADLYALGATLHMLLSGRPPFQGLGPAEIIHAHLARVPEAPPGPPLVRRLVARLLAKSPDDRYHGALALADDLDAAARIVEAGGEPGFTLGAADRPTRLRWPQRLFGRDEQLAQLEHARQEAVDGRSVWVRIVGWSGMGKTALAEAARAPMVDLGGRVTSGKFQQFGRSEPWSAFVAALRPLLAETVAAHPSVRRTQGARLAQGLGANAAVAFGLLPELAALLPEAPAPEALQPGEIRNRLQAILLATLRSYASADEPLALFLDDLQWADGDSLALLEALWSDGGSAGLLVMAAWRDNEVGPDHPLRATIQRMGEAFDSGHEIHVGPLGVGDLAAWLAATLDAGPAEVAPLAQVLARATGGNPFFARRLVEAMRDDGTLRLEQGRWTWDLARAASRPVTADVGSLLATQLRTAAPDVRAALCAAAFLGSSFELSDLMGALSLDPQATAGLLAEAARRGLVALHGGQWECLSVGEVPEGGAQASFVHDAVQGACYALCAEGDRPALHLRLARQLRGGVARRPEVGIAVAEHLMQAEALLVDPAERFDAAVQLAGAAQRAVASAAFQRAADFADLGLRLAGPTLWDLSADLGWGLGALAVQSHTLLAHFARAEGLLSELEGRPLEGSRFFDRIGLRMALEGHRGNLPGVIDHGLSALAALGASIDRSATPAELGTLFAEIGERLAGRDPSSLAGATWNEDPVDLAVQRFLTIIGPCAYLCQQTALWQRLTVELVLRALRSGTTAFTTYGCACMALITAGGMGLYREAAAWGRAGIAVADRAGSAAMRASAGFHMGGFVAHWSEPYADAATIVVRASRDALDAGDLIGASWNLASAAITTALQGAHADEMLDAARRCAALAERHGLVDNALFEPPIRAFIAGLRGESDAPGQMDSLDFQTAAFVQTVRARPFQVPLHVFHVLSALLRLSVGDAPGALAALRAGDPYVATSFSMPVLAEDHSLRAILPALLAEGVEDAFARDALAARPPLERMAAAGPRHFGPKLAWLDAELARAAGDLAGALVAYERAFDGFRADGALLWEALVAGRVAAVLERAGALRSARIWRTDAVHTWTRFGAAPKDPRRAQAGGAGTMMGTTAVPVLSDSLATSTDGGNVDVETVLKASRSIAGELDLSQLLLRLCHLAMENVGADGVFLLLDGDQGLRRVAVGDARGQFERGDLPFETCDAPSPAIVRLALASRVPILVEDALQDPRLARDPAIRARSVRSALAVPLVHQRRLAGVMVLENNLSPGVFGAEREELMRMLSSQIAIALSNAALVDDLKVLNQAYARFVPQGFLRFLGKERITDVRLGDAVEREMTVLFSDIASFTTISEGMTPVENFEFINRYLSQVGPVIRQHGGYIDKYIGDGIMALFPGAADDGLRAGLAIQRAVTAFNTSAEWAGRPRLRVGVGLHRGRLMLGTIGEHERMDGTVIADAVNTAARVEGLTRKFGCDVLLTQSVVDALQDRGAFLVRRLGSVGVKGKTSAVRVLEAFDHDAEPIRSAKTASRAQFEAAVDALEAGKTEEAVPVLRSLAAASCPDAVAGRLIPSLS